MFENPLAKYKDKNEKRHMFERACANGEIAWDCNGCKHALRSLKIDDVEFIAGLWRVQNKFDNKVQVVRGKEVIISEKLNRVEQNLFEFYKAYIVNVNCYGRYIIQDEFIVVAKYETDHKVYWGYGNTIEAARAFLGIRLYDKYRDLIHSVVCKEKMGHGSK